MIRYLVNIILIILPTSRFFRFRNLLLTLSGVNVDGGVKFCGMSWIHGRGRLVIGKGSWLSPGVIIFSHQDAPISIGNNCDIGPGVNFITGSHEIGPESRRAGSGSANPIIVGDGCWIGAYSKILGGVTIGKGAVIAAGSVVVKDVAENTLVAGVPARFKKLLN